MQKNINIINLPIETQILLELLKDLLQDHCANKSFFKFQDTKHPLKLLQRHRLSSYFHKIQSRHEMDQTLRDQLKINYLKNIKFQLALVKEFLQIKKLLDVNEVKFLTLKGPVLSHILYEDPYTRNFKDIDVLISGENIEKTEGILINAGFEVLDDIVFKDLDRNKRDYLLKSRTHMVYRKTSSLGKPLILELHWSLVSPFSLFPFSFQYLWENSIDVTIHNVQIKTIQHELNFAYLLVHGSIHQWVRLQWLVDIINYEKKESLIDEFELKKIIKEGQLEISIAQAHNLYQLLFGIESRFSQLHHKNWNSRIITNFALSEISRVNQYDSSEYNNLNSFINLILLKNDLKHYIEVMKNFIISLQDWKLVQLPSFMFPLYAIGRPIFYLMRKFKVKR